MKIHWLHKWTPSGFTSLGSFTKFYKRCACGAIFGSIENCRQPSDLAWPAVLLIFGVPILLFVIWANLYVHNLVPVI